MNTHTQQNFILKLNNENEAAIKASFQVAHLLAKQGKPFRDELIKLCLIEQPKQCVQPEERKLFKTGSARQLLRELRTLGTVSKVN